MQKRECESRIVQLSEYYVLLPNYDKDFIDTVLNIHDSYTNQKGTDEGWFDFIFKLVENIIDDKIDKNDESIQFIIRGIPETLWYIEPFTQIKNVIHRIYHDNESIQSIQLMITNIDATELKILEKHVLIN